MGITDKNKADELLARVGIQSSERSRIISLAKDTLSQSEADVKQNNGFKYSYAGVKAADTEYLALAENPAENELRLREMVERAAYDAGYLLKK